MKKPKSGELRLCLNFKKLNSVTEPDPYPMPRMERIMADMSGSSYFAALDCRSGYWCVPMDPADAHKTGFTTPFGNFQFNRMPFGLVSAGATYQRLADKITHDLAFCAAYVDDLYLHAKTWREHIDNLRVLLQWLRTYGLKLNAAKCTWAASHISCLGYIVGKDGVKVDPEKVSAVVSLPTPRSISYVRSFIGMCSYYRAHIPDFARIAAPMQQLTKKNARFEWSAECSSAFEKLKVALTSAEVLRLPNWDLPFILTTDFSLTGLGAVLSQIDPKDGQEYAVSYASRALTPSEQRYAPTEGEMLGLVWGIEKYRYYLYGRKFTVHCDHHALQWIQTARFSNSKVERWALKLQEYQFDVVYKKGMDNTVADCLSRSVAINIARMLCHKPDPADFRAQVLAMTLSLAAQPSQPIWPDDAARQRDLDDVPCCICLDAAGHDNMVICDGCQRCFHLRCLTPPACSVPQGAWHCPACEHIVNSTDELCMQDTPLRYRGGDIYLDLPLMRYVYDSTLPDDTATARLVRDRATRNIRVQPQAPHWPIVRFKPREHPDRWLLCPPVEFRWDLIRVFHCDLLAHSGVEQTLAAMHQHLHWPGMKADIASYIKCCDSCQRHKLLLPAEPVPQQPVIYGPFRHVHCDLAGPFSASIVPDFVAANLEQSDSVAHAYIMLMVDYVTKVAEFAVIYGKKSATIARAFWNGWLCRYGVPDCVTTDNARDFDGDFARLMQRQGIKHIRITPLNAAANGAVERLVRSVKSMVTQYVNDHPAHWIQSLPTVRMAYMSRLHSTLRITPSQMLMGFTPRPPTTVSNLFAANSRPVLIASAVSQALTSGTLASHSAHDAATDSAVAMLMPGQPAAHTPDGTSDGTASPMAHAFDDLLYIDSASDEELQAIYHKYVNGLAGYLGHQYDLADAALRRHSAKVVQRWLTRQWKIKRMGTNLQVGDLVLELVGPSPGAFCHNVIGPFKIVAFTNHHRNNAVLQTGATEFRGAQRYIRRVRSLAKYYTVRDLLP